MKWYMAGLVALAVLTPAVTARNVIRVYGGQEQWGEYQVQMQGTDDVELLITGNSHPETPWRVEAYDDSGSVPYPPGIIDRIRIDAQAVGGIHLYVQGDASAGRARGATNVGEINLIDNGSTSNPNFIDLADMAGNYGAYGPMKAFDIDPFVQCLTGGGCPPCP